MRKKIIYDHRAKCIEGLNDLGAPLDGWHCAEILDERDDCDCPPECEVCWKRHPDFIHVMRRDGYGKEVKACLKCAKVMEGQHTLPESRERIMRLRSKEREKFIVGAWRMPIPGYWKKKYNGQMLEMQENPAGVFTVKCGGKSRTAFKGHTLDDMRLAILAAFELAVPAYKSERKYG